MWYARLLNYIVDQIVYNRLATNAIRDTSQLKIRSRRRGVKTFRTLLI